MISTQKKIDITKRLLSIATVAVRLKEQKELPRYRRLRAAKIYKKQAEAFESDLESRLVPFFKKQIQRAIEKLKATTTVDITAKDIFDPEDWNKELVNIALPSIAKAAAESAMAQYLQIQSDLKRQKAWDIARGTKEASTASEWYDSLDDDQKLSLQDVVFDTPHGKVSMRFMTEYPPWMKKLIEEHLQETFDQPYWADINMTTAGDIEYLLKDGIQNGKSIADMATEMMERYGSDLYPKSRGRLIARTESGNALNGPRSKTIDKLKADLGDQYPMRKVWLSVLGNTTRDTHADLDGVPAGGDGCWALGGVRCRWPGDVRLPAGERCNCQCSVVTEFGMRDFEADELIAESELRQQVQGKSVVNAFDVKCGGPGSGVPGPCPMNKPPSNQNADRQSAARQIVSDTKKDGLERAFFVFKDGSISDITKGDETGDNAAVDKPNDPRAMIKGSDIELVHTHPISSKDYEYTGLSTGDLANLHQWPGVTSITAIDMDNKVFTVTRLKSDEDSLRSLWIRQREIKAKVEGDNLDLFIDEKIDKAELKRKQRMSPIAIIAQLQVEGWVTYSESTLPPK